MQNSPANPWSGAPDPVPASAQSETEDKDREPESSWPLTVDPDPPAGPQNTPSAAGAASDAAAAWRGAAPAPAETAWPAVPSSPAPAEVAPAPPGAPAGEPVAAASLADWDLDFAGPATPSAPAAMVLEISVGQRRFDFPLSEGSILLGRPDPSRGIQPDIDLRPDDTVSRRHAQILGRGGHYFLIDLGSTNGSAVNQRALAPNIEVEIRPGDEITLGEQSRVRVHQA